MAMALVPAVLTLNVSPCSFSVAVDRQFASCPTIDLDPTGVEVYGKQKRGVAFNYPGQRCGRPHPAIWAEAGLVLAADLGSPGTDDPWLEAPSLIDRAPGALPEGLEAPIFRGGLLEAPDRFFLHEPPRSSILAFQQGLRLAC